MPVAYVQITTESTVYKCFSVSPEQEEQQEQLKQHDQEKQI